MNEFPWQAVTAVGGSAGMLVGAVVGVIKWVLAALEKRDHAAAAAHRERDEKIAALNGLLTVEVARVTRELADYKVEVAQRYATTEAVREVANEVRDALKGVTEELRGINRRIDDVVAKGPAARAVR
jgi:hypothetical protein